MDWKIYLITIGVLALVAGIPIIVLAVKLKRARALAATRWTDAERARRALEGLRDEVDRMIAEHEARELTDAEALDRLRAGLDRWNPGDDTGGDGAGSADADGGAQSG